jgi:diguanylate cyclase (GGDEF)-like protein
MKAFRLERDAASRKRNSTAAIRAKKIADRLNTAVRRDEVARIRDQKAVARDFTASTRDQAAADRDTAADVRERRAVEEGNKLGEALITLLRSLRVSGASTRERASVERILAAADRQAAAADREQAATDRNYAGRDELTGVLRRGAGEIALTREIERSRRSGRSLVLAMIDIDSLKAVNDNQGHAAGDALLRDVPTAIATALRPYDVTVRWGGDEFVCGLSDVTLTTATGRLAGIQAALTARCPPASVSAGLAELGIDDTLESLVGRADAALYRAKANRQK